jgi:PEGA domain
MRPLSSCAPLILVLLVSAPAALAQVARDTPKPLAESLQGPAKGAYDSATMLVQNHDFAGALAKFKEAYAASEDPRLLYDMAVCEKNLRRYARMQILLEKYARDAGPRMAPDERAAVDAAVGAIKNLVGTLKLTVNVDGASILIDGEPAGVSPLDRPLVVDLGTHTITVKKEGFETAQQPTDTVGGGESEISITLTPHAAQEGHLTVATASEAMVAIDGKLAGAGRYDGPLAPGVHELEVTQPGKVTYREELELRDGETRTVQVTLEDAKRLVLWPWIAGGAAVVAGAVVGGYFLFKTREESGPPPSGALGTVYISAFGAR